VIDNLIRKEEEPEQTLNEEQQTKVKDIFGKAVSQPNMEVSVAHLHAEELPVTVTMDEFTRRMKDMAKMGGGMSFYGSLPDNYKVVVNGNHPLVSRILNTGDEAEQAKLAKQAIDLALLSQGMLTGADLTEFVKRSVSMI
jgi:molecular chaperone HtpG